VPRFSPTRVLFGRPPVDGDDHGDGLPTPFKAKAVARRMAGIKEARGIVEHLPELGGSVHLIHTARLDVADILDAMLDSLGPCDKMMIGTLGMNRRNLSTMLNWLDGGRVQTIGLLVSRFFGAHKPDLLRDTLEEFRSRRQRAAQVDSHAKVATLHLADGRAFVCHGSGNLASNGSSREQLVIEQDPALAAWHARWIEELVSKHEGTTASDRPAS
jgi:hypothetical protein